MKEHVPKDIEPPSDDLLRFIIGTSLRKNWLTGREHHNFKNHAFEIKNHPDLAKIEDENVFGVYSKLYNTNSEKVFTFLDEDSNCAMLNKALITPETVCTWHPDIVFNHDDGMNYIDVAFKRRKNTNKLLKKLVCYSILSTDFSQLQARHEARRFHPSEWRGYFTAQKRLGEMTRNVAKRSISLEK